MKRRLSLVAAALAAAVALGAPSAGQPSGAAVTWPDLAPLFRPPASFQGKLGSYRSPLIFDDGSPVRSAAEWPRRRAEIPC